MPDSDIPTSSNCAEVCEDARTARAGAAPRHTARVAGNAFQALAAAGDARVSLARGVGAVFFSKRLAFYF